jgi:hypothetical protein
MFRTIRLMAFAAAAGVVGDRIYLELRKPAAEQFPWLRRQVNENVNPWLLEHNIPGSAKAEIATLEHVGRVSGATYHTPVHPTLRDDTILIPAPLGTGSQWAQNVLEAGRARLQFHELLYDVDRPELIAVAETGFFAPPIAGPVDRMGWRYLRLHVVASTPGAFATHRHSFESALEAEPSLTEPFDIPMEPRMVDREGAPA